MDPTFPAPTLGSRRLATSDKGGLSDTREREGGAGRWPAAVHATGGPVVRAMPGA